MRKIIKALTAITLAAALLIGIIPANAAETVSWPVIKSGSTGANAAALQYLLISKGYNVTADGVIGTTSVTAIKSFQSENGLTPDGIAGANTLTYMVELLKSGTKDVSVTALQFLLKNKFGISVTVDGYFGSNTATAVKAFQSSKGLTADGIVGVVTWKYLFGSTQQTTATSSAADKAIAKAKSLLGSTEYNGLCQRFVRISYEAAGITGYASTANEAWKKWGVSTSPYNIPKGAAVYFNTSSSGHAGIYMGNGYVIHAVATVRIESLDALSAKYGFIGWGYQGGVNPN